MVWRAEGAPVLDGTEVDASPSDGADAAAGDAGLPPQGPAGTTKYAFPAGLPYAHGIRPNNHTQSELNADVVAMWKAWRSTYLVSKGAGQGLLRVTKGGDDGDSISEGTGYGLLISAYIADGDNTGKSDFDALFRYYKSKEKVVGDTAYGLMAWRVAGDGTIADNYVAPDGDIDAAFALLVADKKWGSGGAINYKEEAAHVIRSLMKWAVLNRGAADSKLIARGDFSLGRVETATDHTMSSYQIVSYFPEFREATGDDRWNDTLIASYKLYNHFYHANPATALTPFTFLTKPGPTQYTKPPQRGYAYSYDAARLPWRVGLDFLWHGTASSKLANAVDPSVNAELARAMPDRNTKWLQKETGGNPQLAKTSYNLDGTPSAGTFIGSQRSFVSPMAVGAMVDASNQTWLNTLYDWMREQVPGKDYLRDNQTAKPDYYHDTVMMVCMLIVTGNMPSLSSMTP